MASFDEKVEALKVLRERRVARAEAEKELTSVLEHYAGLQDPVQLIRDLSEEKKEPATPADAQVQSDEADALYCLGHCTEQGLHECESDKCKAAVYYRMAAEKGSSLGQWRLGHLHEFGEGVEQSDVQAAHWYLLAAEAGHPQAQSSLALLLEDGRLGDCDDAEALRWHLAAADQNQALSQYCAACCLAEGRGAEQDEVAANALLEKSAAAGFPMAVEALSRGSLWKHTSAPEHRVVAAGADASLLDMAARVAKQIGHLPDDEAEVFLDELLSSLDYDPGNLDSLAGELYGALAQVDLDPNLEDNVDKSFAVAWNAASGVAMCSDGGA